MMSKVYLFVTVLLMTVSTANAQTPLQFNDKLASITDSLYAKGQAWGRTFNASYKSGDYSPLKSKSSNMLSFINSKIAYVQNLKDLKDSKPLRMAMLDLLAFEKKMITEGFKPFEAFNSATPQEKVKAALDNLTEKSKDENVYIRKLAAAQEKYAEQNGFKIEAAPTSESAKEELQ